MPMLTRCCFSRNLRNGTIVCGGWSLVTCVFSVGININDINQIYHDPTHYANVMYEDSTGLLVFDWISLIVSILTVISSILLFIAVIKNYARLAIPWMLMIAVQILFDAVGIIFNIILDGLSKILIAILLIWIVFTLINIYCELCVMSHYQELKLGRGRREDYLETSRSVRYVPEVQHVHIADGPINYVQSQHTVYSFHSQTLFEDEAKGSPKPARNGGLGSNTVLSACGNGRVLELRPVASVPSNMDARFGGLGNNHMGSIEMKIVDSAPVMVDRRTLTNYNGGLEVAPAIGYRSRRFRTVSESAVRQPLIHEGNASTSSLRNITEQSKNLASSTNSTNTDNNANSGASSKASTLTVSDVDAGAPTVHKEVKEPVS